MRIRLAQPGVTVGVVRARIDVVSDASRFGHVHRHVGPAEEHAQVAALPRKQCDADAHIGLEGNAFESERHSQGGPELDGDRNGVCVVGVIQQNRELVTAEPGKQRVGVELGPEPAPDLDQQPVADIVPEAVVYLLEPVEVQEQQGEGLTVRRSQQTGDVGIERPPVRQAGEVVGSGQSAQISHPDQLLECELRPGG
jgi:hypothetical protein